MRHERTIGLDALHAAVCIASDGATLCSWDRDFDVIPGVVRRSPDSFLEDR